MADKTLDSLIQRYRRLIELSCDLASTLNLDVLLNRIINSAADLIGVEAASILLYDESKQQLHFQVSTNMDQPLMRGLIVPVDSSLAGWIITNREPVIVNDVQNDPRYYHDIEDATDIVTTSLLGIPLITKDKVVGVLEAINKKKGEFEADDLSLLTALGAQAAVAIENAYLFQQSDLISDLIHELRTPLASLNAATHLLLRPEVSEEQRRDTIEIIHNETVRLAEMTTSFLDLARLESGRTQFKIEEFDLGELLEECASIVSSRVAENGLSLDLKYKKRLPVAYGDNDKIKQVVLNLLSNAINYNRPNGSITLEGRSGNGEVKIIVSDTGRGIFPENLPYLFEKFFRAPGSDKIAHGTGLGLSISKRIVEAHGGSIGVESEAGVGTTFTVHLPTQRGR